MELDRRIRAGQSDVGKERPEPGLGLYYAFEMLVALVSWDVGGAPGQQCPARRRSRQIAAPDLHDTGLARDDKKRGGQRLHPIRCHLLEELAEPGKLSPP